jgi:hypothetical protein
MGPIFLAPPRWLTLSLPAGSSPWHVMMTQAHASSTAASWIGLMLKEQPTLRALADFPAKFPLHAFSKNFRWWGQFRFLLISGERRTTFSSETVNQLTGNW